MDAGEVTVKVINTAEETELYNASFTESEIRLP